MLTKTIDIKDVASHLNETAALTAKAFSARDRGSMVLVNLGAAYPDQLLTVVWRDEAKIKGNALDGKTIT